MPMQVRTPLIFTIVCVAVFAIAIFLVGYSNGSVIKDNEDPFLITLESVKEIEPLPARDRYGFEKGIYEFEEHEIKKNESLYIILRRYDISPQQIYQIQQESKGVANLNRMVPGQRYRVYFKDNQPVSFVWHQELTRYITVDWQNEYRVGTGEIPIRFVTKEASGIIRSSLYETIVAQGHSPYLGSELAGVFAWQVDFFALRSGDHFKVIYEERYAGDEFVGIGDVKAAEFQHRGETHQAFFLNHEERRGYFDEDGNSLEKELLKAPFRYSQRVSSGFSRNRFHPILKRNRPHYGTDYAAPTGTPILAVGEGIVTEAQRRGGNGNIVQIRHSGSYRTAYLHMNGFAPGIRKGVKVEQGQVIGYVGQTGLATGPHLCYRMYVNDRPINSVSADLPASESLEESLMPDFQRVVDRYRSLLDALNFNEKVAGLEENINSERASL
ncbi:M23 family metallopeptidase [Rhodohalobacter sp. 8-1]|uniref:M23 family metallopeptidase n=1 Tax=Rhodohalobacter sp. 8-1 TaxID=3131972 RepID=UPI0030EF4FAD